MLIKNLRIHSLNLDPDVILNELRKQWLLKEFDNEYKEFRKNSDDTYTVFKIVKEFIPLHDNSEPFYKEISLDCTEEQNKVLESFRTLIHLKI